MAIIELENVSKTYRDGKESVDAVRHVSLAVEKGEIYGIIGFSGAGKSTLVRCINFLERPTEGTVRVDGTDLSGLSSRKLRELRKKIGMIFQQFNLMDSRTVAENVALPLQYGGLSRKAIEEKVDRLLDFVGLRDKADRYPAQLSGGQKQRVAIARALANDPKVLLCDEATSALDPQTTWSILKLLKRLNQEMGITIVVITHEMQVVKRICSRVAVMEQGEVVEEGDIFSVFARPKEAITKSFIATTSSLSHVEELLADHSPVLALKPGSCLVHLKYLKESVSEPLISIITKNYDLQCNILFSDVEIVGGWPMGGTISIISGKAAHIGAALDYLKQEGIGVEVIRDARSA